MREEAEHGFFGPLALVEVVAVLGEAAAIDAAGAGAARAAEGFAEVVDAGPHEVAGDVVVGADEFPELFGVEAAEAADHAASGSGRGGRGGGPGEQRAVVAAGAAHARAFGADHAPFGVGELVDAVVKLAALAPAVGVVIADDIEEVEKFDRSGARLGGDLVAGGGDGAGGIFAVEDGDEIAQQVGAAGGELVGDLVAAAP